MAENSISTIIGLPFFLHRLIHRSDVSAYTTEELPPALVHLTPVERPAVLVPIGFLRFTHPARPLPPGESEIQYLNTQAQVSPGALPPNPPPYSSCHLSRTSVSIHRAPPFTAALCATSCQSLLSLSSSAHPLRTPGTVASRRLAFSKVGRSHQTSSSHCVLPSTVPPGYENQRPWLPAWKWERGVRRAKQLLSP